MQSILLALTDLNHPPSYRWCLKLQNYDVTRSAEELVMFLLGMRRVDVSFRLQNLRYGAGKCVERVLKHFFLGERSKKMFQREFSSNNVHPRSESNARYVDRIKLGMIRQLTVGQAMGTDRNEHLTHPNAFQC